MNQNRQTLASPNQAVLLGAGGGGKRGEGVGGVGGGRGGRCPRSRQICQAKCQMPTNQANAHEPGKQEANLPTNQGQCPRTGKSDANLPEILPPAGVINV